MKLIPVAARGRGAALMALILVAHPVWTRAAGPWEITSNQHYEEGDWVTFSVTRFVNSLAIGREHIYYGTTGGILRYNFYRQEWSDPWTVSDGLLDNDVQVVAFDFEHEYVIASTPSGLNYYNPTNTQWYGFPTNESESLSHVLSIGLSRERVILEDTFGDLWIGSVHTDFFSRITPDNPDFPALETIRWFGRKGPAVPELPNYFMDGGYMFDARGVIHDVRLRDYNLTTAANDDWFNQWIGTWGMGAVRGDLKMERLQLLPFGLYQHSVHALASQDGVIWAGGVLDEHEEQEEPGITRWEPEANEWEYFEARFDSWLISDRIHAITAEEDRVWFGTDFGISIHDPRGWRTIDDYRYLDDPAVYDVVVDDEWAWAGTGSGLFRLTRNIRSRKDSLIMEEVRPKGLKFARINDLELADGLLWAATDYGLYVYHVASDSGGYYAGADGPGASRTSAVDVSAGRLWVGSDDAIDVFDLKTRKWIGVPWSLRKRGLRVRRLAVIPEAAWAATNRGLYKFDPEREYWRLFTMKDGLPSNQLHDLLVDGDYIWIGSDEGLTRFYWNDPHRID